MLALALVPAGVGCGRGRDIVGGRGEIEDRVFG